ncbi:MAG: methylmalonyl-CoA epimerase [FCB group bacterium]|nr:methylmalonyl-CoA epimerase [FCB group bacterium]
MKIKKIDHLGIAVGPGGKSQTFWETIMGLESSGNERVENQGVDTRIYPVGESKIELLESLGDDSPIAKFLKSSGPGIHHVCFEVDDIRDAIRELIDHNIRVIFPEPRPGVENYEVTFIHPGDTGGVLVELAQKKGTVG